MAKLTYRIRFNGKKVDYASSNKRLAIQDAKKMCKEDFDWSEVWADNLDTYSTEKLAGFQMENGKVKAQD